MSFILAHGGMTWRQAKWGLDRGLITSQAIVDLACARIAQSPDPVLLDLCTLSAEDTAQIASALERLCSGEPETPMVEAWVRHSLRWVSERWRTYENFPGVLEEIMVFFGYPDEFHELNVAVAGKAGLVRDPDRDRSEIDRNFLKLVHKCLAENRGAS